MKSGPEIFKGRLSSQNLQLYLGSSLLTLWKGFLIWELHFLQLHALFRSCQFPSFRLDSIKQMFYFFFVNMFCYILTKFAFTLGWCFCAKQNQKGTANHISLRKWRGRWLSQDLLRAFQNCIYFIPMGVGGLMAIYFPWRTTTLPNQVTMKKKKCPPEPGKAFGEA